MHAYFNAKCLMAALIASCGWSSYMLNAAESAPAAVPQAEMPAAAEEAKKKKLTVEEILAPEYLKQLSQTYGHMIQKSLSNPYIKINLDDVVKGMQEAQAGKPAPLSDKDYENAMRMLQNYARTEAIKTSTAEAETFLKQNASQEGVVELEAGKIQYKILQPGTGEVVTDETQPKVNYSATMLNGTSIGSSDQHGGPIDLVLKDTIPGLHKGVLGMKVGEKRRLFLHPDAAFGSAGGPANGLVIFDIEVVSVAPKPAESASLEDEEMDDDEDMEDVSFDDLVEATDDDEFICDDEDSDDGDDIDADDDDNEDADDGEEVNEDDEDLSSDDSDDNENNEDEE